MSEPTYNTDLLMQVREKIVTEPEKHRQGEWASATSDPTKGGDCGTAYCVAGWTTVLDGQTLQWMELGNGHWIAGALADGTRIFNAAQWALGLDRFGAHRLFDGLNSRAYVLRVLDALIEASKNGERLTADDPVWQQ